MKVVFLHWVLEGYFPPKKSSWTVVFSCFLSELFCTSHSVIFRQMNSWGSFSERRSQLSFKNAKRLKSFRRCKQHLKLSRELWLKEQTYFPLNWLSNERMESWKHLLAARWTGERQALWCGLESLSISKRRCQRDTEQSKPCSSSGAVHIICLAFCNLNKFPAS